ncbi:hypothetical protein ACJX0J_026692, partial [Zea mays]
LHHKMATTEISLARMGLITFLFLLINYAQRLGLPGPNRNIIQKKKLYKDYYRKIQKKITHVLQIHGTTMFIFRVQAAALLSYDTTTRKETCTYLVMGLFYVCTVSVWN